MHELCVDETGENCEENGANGEKLGLYPMCPVAGDRSASGSAALHEIGSSSGSGSAEETGAGARATAPDSRRDVSAPDTRATPGGTRYGARPVTYRRRDSARAREDADPAGPTMVGRPTGARTRAAGSSLSDDELARGSGSSAPTLDAVLQPPTT
jgi:hypothetical protein